MKKLTALLLTVAVLVGLLSGCNTKEKELVETVRVWTSNSHSFGRELNFINNYNKTEGKNKGIYIDYILKAYNLYEELDKAMAADDVPEFSSWANFSLYAEKGMLVAIDDLPGGKEVLAEHKQKNLDYAPYTEHNGKIYSLPIGISTQGLAYNKDMFKKAGIVDENGEALAPQTLEEMRLYAKKLTNREKGEYGIIFPMKWDTAKAYKGEESNEQWFSQDIFSMVIASMGADAYLETQGLGQTFLPYMDMIMGMRNDGSIYPGAEDMTNESARAIFSGGGVGMKMSSAFDVGVFNYQFPVEDDWGIAPVPTLHKEKRYNQVGTFSCTNMIYGKAAEKVEAKKLTEVLKMFISDEYKLMLYEEGLQMPYGLDISGIPAGDMLKGWKEFAKLTQNIDILPGGLLGSGDNLPQIFVNDVYLGNKDLDEAIKEHDENLIKKWIEAENEAH